MYVDERVGDKPNKTERESDRERKREREICSAKGSEEKIKIESIHCISYVWQGGCV